MNDRPEQLLPCPYCGTALDPSEVSLVTNEGERPRKISVACPKCDAQGPPGTGKVEGDRFGAIDVAMHYWNRRNSAAESLERIRAAHDAFILNTGKNPTRVYLGYREMADLIHLADRAAKHHTSAERAAIEHHGSVQTVDGLILYTVTEMSHVAVA